ncbi:unnamed protein product, partial [Linum tenue]
MASKACILLFLLLAACFLISDGASRVRLSTTNSSPLPSIVSDRVDGVLQAESDFSPPAPVALTATAKNG